MTRLIAALGGAVAVVMIGAMATATQGSMLAHVAGWSELASTPTPTPEAVLIPAAGAPRPTVIPTKVPSFAPASSIQPGSLTPPFSREQALAFVRNPASGAKIVDRIDAKLITLGQFFRAQGQPEAVSGLDPSTLVWIVAVSGDFQMPIGHGIQKPWGAVIIDATTGLPLGSLGDTQAPAWVATLSDLAK
jgi:hypothetical protein